MNTKEVHQKHAESAEEHAKHRNTGKHKFSDEEHEGHLASTEVHEGHVESDEEHKAALKDHKSSNEMHAKHLGSQVGIYLLYPLVSQRALRLPLGIILSKHQLLIFTIFLLATLLKCNFLAILGCH